MTSPHPGFNLVDDPWIELGDQLVSIREALVSGHELPGWPSGEPAAGPVIIRLLMPIVYRVTGMDDPGLRGRRFAAPQGQLLGASRLESARVDEYLDSYRDRFWLTRPPAGCPPFAQDPALAALESHPIAKLMTTWASGNNPALGPHGNVATIDPASATRGLLITHNYSSGGLHTRRPAGGSAGKFVASRLRRSVSIHPIGSSFTATLLHHLVPVPDGWEIGQPFWETPSPVDPAARPRRRTGLLEQLSGRHDKTVLLAQDDHGAISGVIVSAGPGRAPGLECPDPYLVMTAGGETYLLRAGRDAWRDLDALVIQSEHVQPPDRLEAQVFDWCRNNVRADPGRWVLVSHRSRQSKEEGWGLTNLPDLVGLFPDGSAAAKTASVVIAAAENASTLMGTKLRALSGALGRDGKSTRYDDARRVFWSLAEHTFWEAVTAQPPDPTAGASWTSRLRHHALEGFDAATRHLIEVPRAHLEVERWRSEVSRWTWPTPNRSERPTEGASRQ